MQVCDRTISIATAVGEDADPSAPMTARLTELFGEPSVLDLKGWDVGAA